MKSGWNKLSRSGKLYWVAAGGALVLQPFLKGLLRPVSMFFLFASGESSLTPYLLYELAVYIVTIFLLKAILERSTLFAEPPPASPSAPVMASGARCLPVIVTQYLIAGLFSAGLAFIGIPMLAALLMFQQPGGMFQIWRFLESPWLPYLLFPILTILLKFWVARHYPRRPPSIPSPVPVFSPGPESAVAIPTRSPSEAALLSALWKKSALFAIGLTLFLAIIYLVLTVAARHHSSHRGSDLAMLFSVLPILAIPGAFVFLIFWPFFAALLRMRNCPIETRQVKRYLFVFIAVPLIVIFILPGFIVPDLLWLIPVAILVALIVLNEKMVSHPARRLTGFTFVAVAAGATILTLPESVAFDAIDEPVRVLAFLLAAIGCGLTIWVTLHRQLGRIERWCYPALIILLTSGYLRVSALPCVRATYNLTGTAVCEGLADQSGTRVTLSGNFSDRHWTIATTVTDRDGTYRMANVRELVTLSEARRGLEHGIWVCMGGTVLSFEHPGYAPLRSDNLEMADGMISPDADGSWPLRKVTLVPEGAARASSAEPPRISSATRQELSQIQSLSGNRLYRERIDDLERRLPPEAPREELNAALVTAMFQEAEHTLFLSEPEWRESYEAISRDAVAWCDSYPASPAAEKLLVIAATARLRLDDRIGYQRLVERLQARFPVGGWREELPGDPFPGAAR